MASDLSTILTSRRRPTRHHDLLFRETNHRCSNDLQLVVSRVGEIHETRRGLPGDPDTSQSRYIEAAVNGILIGGLYMPNGNPRPGPKFVYKMRWLRS